MRLKNVKTKEMEGTEGKQREGHRGVTFTDEERLAYVTNVCELYESQNATIESCCKAAGISYRVFRLWCTQNADYASMYKKARDNQDKAYWEDVIRPKAKAGLIKLLEGGVKTETTTEEGVGPMGAVSKTVVKVSELLPNVTAVALAMNGEYKERFSQRQEITGKDGKDLPAAIITVRIPAEPPKTEE
jgi:hypothetical protein